MKNPDTKQQKAFEFSYNKPSLDWFDTINIKLKPEDYYYYKLERRYGRSWWLIGCNPVEEPNYHWEEKQIGEIGKNDLLKFIDWCKTNEGNLIIQIKVLDSTFNIFDEINNLLKIKEDLND